MTRLLLCLLLFSASVPLLAEPFKIQPVGDETPPDLRKYFSKRTAVFGITVLATSDTPDGKILHVAKVLAEYLDSDEDGTPNNPLVVAAIKNNRGGLMMVPREGDFERRQINAGPRYLVGLYAEQVLPDGAKQGEFDASLEEVVHLVTAMGYAKVYPEVFGERPGSRIAQAMDNARGGHFREVPRQYPHDAWYTYYDMSCDYRCQITEYTYWGLTSILGGQDFRGRAENIADEWRLSTREKVKRGDPDLFALLTNPKYRLPTRLPNGKYMPADTTANIGD